MVPGPVHLQGRQSGAGARCVQEEAAAAAAASKCMSGSCI